MKTSILTLLCATHVAFAGVINVHQKRCTADDKSCQYKGQPNCLPHDKFCNYRSEPSCLLGNRNCTHECFEQVASRGQRARADCNSFLQRNVNYSVTTGTTTETIPAVITVISTPTVYSTSTVYSTPTVYSTVSRFITRTVARVPLPRDPGRIAEILPHRLGSLGNRYPLTGNTLSGGSTTKTTMAKIAKTTTKTTTITTAVESRAVVSRTVAQRSEWDNGFNRFMTRPVGLPIYASSCNGPAEYVKVCYQYVEMGGVGVTTVTAKATRTVVKTKTIVIPTTSPVHFSAPY